ncbi:hypothetical protein ABZ546_01520 [Brachybacterium paraconglomeratum]
MQHGGWLPLLEEVGISQRVAQEFMSLARNAALANASNYSHLPTSPTALYQLSRLAPEVIESGIERGDIHPASVDVEAGEVIEKFPSLQCEPCCRSALCARRCVRRDRAARCLLLVLRCSIMPVTSTT